MGAAKFRKISMLKLRHNLTNVANEVLFKKKNYIVTKNKNDDLAFLIIPLKGKRVVRDNSAEEYWESMIVRSKLKNLSLDKIQQHEKKKRKY